MPLKRCGDGWKWGDSGKCYTGPNGKKQAIKQGIVIEGPDKFREKAAELVDIEETDVRIMEDVMIEEGFALIQITAMTMTLNKVIARQRYIYEDPKTGEQYTFTRMGNHEKNGRRLHYVGKANSGKDE